MSQTAVDSIISMFEQVADRGGDITARVIDRYFQRCADSQALMDHMDEHMLGRMMDQVLLLLMESGEAELDSYLKFETANHRAYGVEQHMYQSLLAAVHDVIVDILGDDLSDEMDAALIARSEFLLGEIGAAG